MVVWRKTSSKASWEGGPNFSVYPLYLDHHLDHLNTKPHFSCEIGAFLEVSSGLPPLIRKGGRFNDESRASLTGFFLSFLGKEESIQTDSTLASTRSFAYALAGTSPSAAHSGQAFQKGEFWPGHLATSNQTECSCKPCATKKSTLIQSRLSLRSRADYLRWSRRVGASTMKAVAALTGFFFHAFGKIHDV